MDKKVDRKGYFVKKNVVNALFVHNKTSYGIVLCSADNSGDFFYVEAGKWAFFCKHPLDLENVRWKFAGERKKRRLVKENTPLRVMFEGYKTVEDAEKAKAMVLLNWGDFGACSGEGS